MIQKQHLVLALPLVVCAGCAEKSQEQQEQQPNIVVILCDDVDPTHFGCYGGVVPTPNIDKMAAQGAVFSNAYCTSSVSTPSRYATLTGKYAGRCIDPTFLGQSMGKDEPYNLMWNTHLTEGENTLHRQLKRGGYYTGYVGKFHCGPNNIKEYIADLDKASDPYDEEVNERLKAYQGVLGNEIKRLTGADYAGAIIWENGEENPIEAVTRHHLEWMTDAATTFFDSCSTDKPFYLHLCSTMLHGPDIYDDMSEGDPHATPGGFMNEPFMHMRPRTEILADRLADGDFLGAEQNGFYDMTAKDIIKHPMAVARVRHFNAGIRYLDEQVGAVMQQLEARGLMENTLIILTADHNTEPGKSVCYQKGVQIPFVALWNGTIEAGSKHDELIQLIDLLPTFAHLSGTEMPAEHVYDGKDFSPLLTNEGTYERPYVYFEMGTSRGVTDGKYKLICTRYAKPQIARIMSGKVDFVNHLMMRYQPHATIALENYPSYFDADQFFALATDPYERTNLVASLDNNAEHRAAYDRLYGYLKQELASIGAPYPLADTTFFATPEYAAAKANTLKMRCTNTIWWDDERFEWPPRH